MKKSLSARQLYERSLRESDVVGAIRTLLELNRAHVDLIVERIPWGKTTSTLGLPDLAGRFPKACLTLKNSIWEAINAEMAISFWLEIKRPGGKLRPAQEAWLEKAQTDGLIAFKADSVDAMVAGFKEFGIGIKGV